MKGLHDDTQIPEPNSCPQLFDELSLLVLPERLMSSVILPLFPKRPVFDGWVSSAHVISDILILFIQERDKVAKFVYSGIGQRARE